MSTWRPFKSNKDKNNNESHNHGHSHGHNHGHNHRRNNYWDQFKALAQTFADKEMQATAQVQTFMEQIDDTVLNVSLAGKGFQTGKEEDLVNMLCDSAIVSLNMLAVSCEYLYKENDRNAIDLGRKRAHDKLSELKSSNNAVYELIEPHRNFITAALNGQKNLRYKEDRVEPGVKTLFENDPKCINGAFAKLIRNSQQFDKHQEAMMDPATNKKLAKQHQSELNEYRRNEGNKYSRNNNNNCTKSGPGSGRSSRAQVKDLYFTKSGKSANFVDTEAVERARREERKMDEDIFGVNDVYDDLFKQITYMNAVLKLSPQKAWKEISKPLPCLILIPTKQQRANHDYTKVKIRPCYPHNDCTLNASLDMLELDEQVIKKVEKMHIRKLKKFEQDTSKHNLGYKSIKDQEREIDIDSE